jgi:23S rRNA (guanosine2251-2'-O)-methyltransferase
MAKQQSKRPRKTSSAGKHQPNWLWGKQSVLGTLEAGRWRVYELYVTTELHDQFSELLKAKQADGVELEVVSTERLSHLSQTAEHQGIVARVSKYPYQTMESLEIQLRVDSDSSDAKPPTLVVILDRVQDSFHFASILRCCQSAGVTGVIVGEHRQSQVTTQVARLSSGAVNHLSIVQSADLVSAVKQVKACGATIIAFASDSPQEADKVSLNSSVALLLGSDAYGIDPLLLGLCDHQVSIPMLGKTSSLNSAISAGILLYEIRRQQRQ